MRFFKKPTEDAIRIHNEALIIDIHCHPTFKVNLFNFKIYDKKHYIFRLNPTEPSPSDEISHMQYDLNQMYFGKIDAIWSSRKNNF